MTTLDTKRNPQDLEKIAQLTLEHYNQYAEEFWQGTRDHDVSQNIAALLQYIRNEPPFKILDFGCGPGRDLKTFAELGHIAIGLEGAVHLSWTAAMSGCKSRSSMPAPAKSWFFPLIEEPDVDLPEAPDAPLSRPVQRIGCITSHVLLGGLHHRYCRI